MEHFAFLVVTGCDACHRCNFFIALLGARTVLRIGHFNDVVQCKVVGRIMGRGVKVERTT